MERVASIPELIVDEDDYAQKTTDWQNDQKQLMAAQSSGQVGSTDNLSASGEACVYDDSEHSPRTHRALKLGLFTALGLK